MRRGEKICGVGALLQRNTSYFRRNTTSVCFSMSIHSLSFLQCSEDYRPNKMSQRFLNYDVLQDAISWVQPSKKKQDLRRVNTKWDVAYFDALSQVTVYVGKKKTCGQGTPFARCSDMLDIRVKYMPCNKCDCVGMIDTKCNCITDEESSTINGLIIESISRSPNLKNVDVSYTKGIITDASIAAIAVRCPHLSNLNVHYTHGAITDVSIMAIAEHCHTLQGLDVRRTRGRITDASLTMIAKGCPDLRRLSVSGFGTMPLLANYPYVPRAITDASIGEIAVKCPNLQHLDVSWTDGDITDASIKEVAVRCPNLQSLNVSHTDGAITDASIKEIAVGCQTLQNLNVGWAEGKITDVAIKAIAERCQKLASLDVCWTDVTNASIREIAIRCSNLRDLRISYTTISITDASLVAIAAKCRDLRKLEVYPGLDGYRDQGTNNEVRLLREIYAECPSLQSINATDRKDPRFRLEERKRVREE